MLPVPFLDRPSAVGDEGRSRVTSLTVASFSVAALVGATGYLAGVPDLLPTLGTVAGLAAIGVASLDRERFVHLFVGHAFVAWFGSLLAALVVVSPFASRLGISSGAFLVALFGLGLTWSDSGDAESLRRVVDASGRTYVAVWLWLSAVGLVSFFGGAIIAVVGLVAGFENPLAVAVALGVVLVGTAGSVVLSLRWLPIRQLTPRRRRADVESALVVVRRVLLAVVAVGVLVVATAIGVELTGSFDAFVERTPLVEGVLRSLTSRVVVGSLVGVAGGCLCLGVLAWFLRWVAERSDPVSRNRLAAALAALPFALVALVGVAAFAIIGPGAILLILYALFAPVIFIITVAIALFFSSIGVLPDRAGGPALAAFGLLLAALGPLPPWLAFLCVAAALLVWDVSTFGLGVTAELGHRPETRRLELVHGILSVGVAVVAVVVATGLYVSSQWTLAGGTLPMLVAGLGALVLLLPLRG